MVGPDCRLAMLQTRRARVVQEIVGFGAHGACTVKDSVAQDDHSPIDEAEQDRFAVNIMEEFNASDM